MKVLVLDDQQDVIDGIVEGVDWEKLKITEVFTANSALEARKLLKRERIDILLSDIEMPGENGMELWTWIRETYPFMKCIFLSAYAKFEYAQECIRQNGFDYLLQPVKYSVLEATIIRLQMQMEMEEEKNSLYRKGKILEKSEAEYLGHYLGDYLQSPEEDRQEALLSAAVEQYGEMGRNSLVCPALFRFDDREEVWGEELLLFAAKNILSEFFADKGQGMFFYISSLLLVILWNIKEGRTFS